MLVVATTAFGEFVRLFWFNFDYQREKQGEWIGPLGGEGFKQIRFFPENGWTTAEVAALIWAFVLIVMLGLWWMDRSRAGSVLRAVGEDELAAQSVGINLTVTKVAAFAVGGFIAGAADLDDDRGRTLKILILVDVETVGRQQDQVGDAVIIGPALR